VYYLLFLAIAVMPTPGGAGFAEGGFFILFANLFAEAAIVPAVLLWRGITYYLLLFCGGIASVIDSVAGMSKKKKLKANPDEA
jgi:uncharacterized protein (TIRG00374 family)